MTAFKMFFNNQISFQQQNNIMESPKQGPKNTIRKLQIKIPNFSHSKQKSKCTTLSKTKLYNSQSQHSYPYARYHSNHAKNTGNQVCTPRKVQEKPKQFAPYKVKSPKQEVVSGSKVMKGRTNSRSPKNRYESPSAKIQADKLLHQQLCKTEVSTSRNIDEVRLKLKTMSTKTPVLISGNYFKKQIPNKLEDMNKTLRKMAEHRQQQISIRNKPKYELKMLKRLGKSQNGDIILALSNINGMLVAIKTFRKQSVKLQFLIDQMKIHLYCEHPHILPAYGYHVGREQVYLCMEFGFNNLYEQILRRGPFTEEKTAKYIMQILLGVEYLHRNGIIHRDLKPENVICFGEHLKITDFGWSIKTDIQRRTLCGTLDYISPEVAQRSYYDNKIDCWSIGVLMYEMLTVKPPFSQSQHKYDFTSLVLPEGLSHDCQDLLGKFLKVNPNTRISAREALDHSWIKNHKNYNLLFQRRQFKELQSEIDFLFGS